MPYAVIPDLIPESGEFTRKTLDLSFRWNDTPGGFSSAALSNANYFCCDAEEVMKHVATILLTVALCAAAFSMVGCGSGGGSSSDKGAADSNSASGDCQSFAEEDMVLKRFLRLEDR